MEVGHIGLLIIVSVFAILILIIISLLIILKDIGKKKQPKQDNGMKPFPLTLEQYLCKDCELKFYINTADNKNNQLECPDCNSKVIKIRKFQTIVESIIPY